MDRCLTRKQDQQPWRGKPVGRGGRLRIASAAWPVPGSPGYGPWGCAACLRRFRVGSGSAAWRTGCHMARRQYHPQALGVTGAVGAPHGTDRGSRPGTTIRRPPRPWRRAGRQYVLTGRQARPCRLGNRRRRGSVVRQAQLAGHHGRGRRPAARRTPGSRRGRPRCADRGLPGAPRSVQEQRPGLVRSATTAPGDRSGLGRPPSPAPAAGVPPDLTPPRAATGRARWCAGAGTLVGWN
jgi:hypothetical protein